MAKILGFGLWHLTAKGWIPGSWRYGDEGEEVPPPVGRVETCRLMLAGSVGGDPREMLSKLWIGLEHARDVSCHFEPEGCSWTRPAQVAA